MSDSRSPLLAEVLNEYLDEAIQNTNVHLPGQIVSFDPSTQLASVKPLLKRPYVDENGEDQTESLPVITNVPVLQAGASGFRITVPVNVNDFVWLGFADRSLDLWLAGDGSELDPVIEGTHQLSDAVAWVGLHPNNAAWTGVRQDAMTLGKDGGPQIHLEAAAIKLGAQTAAQSLVLGDQFFTHLATFLAAFSTFSASPFASITTAATTLSGLLSGDKSTTVKTE